LLLEIHIVEEELAKRLILHCQNVVNAFYGFSGSIHFVEPLVTLTKILSEEDWNEKPYIEKLECQPPIIVESDAHQIQKDDNESPQLYQSKDYEFEISSDHFLDVYDEYRVESIGSKAQHKDEHELNLFIVTHRCQDRHDELEKTHVELHLASPLFVAPRGLHIPGDGPELEEEERVHEIIVIHVHFLFELRHVVLFEILGQHNQRSSHDHAAHE